MHVRRGVSHERSRTLRIGSSRQRRAHECHLSKKTSAQPRELLVDVLEGQAQMMGARSLEVGLGELPELVGLIGRQVALVLEPQVARALELGADLLDRIASPLRFSGTPVVTPVAAPALGHENRAVLGTTLGYDAEKIQALFTSGALGNRE